MGVSQNKTLAKLTDLNSMYARMWANPAIQIATIEQLLESSGEESEGRLLLAEAMVVQGTCALAQYGMKKDHNEHLMSLMLLENIGPALRLISQKRNAGTGTVSERLLEEQEFINRQPAA